MFPLNYPMYPYFPASFKYETLSNLNPGDFVVLYNDGANKLVVEKQVIDAFNLYFGFVTNSYTAGQVAEIYGLRVVNNQLVGLVPGDTYYAHPTNPGEVTNVLPVGTSVIQQVGVAINTTDLDTQYYNNYEGSGGGVTSVTGLNTDNTDPTNPIVEISVDGVTITGDGTPANPLVSAAGGIPTLRNVTATTTFATAEETINCTANTFTINLPTAIGIQGTTYTLVNSGTGVITLDANGTETINGSLTIALSTQYISRTVQSDGANWIII